MRDVLATIGAGCVGCFLLLAAWITSNEVSQRAAARRAARTPIPRPLMEYAEEPPPPLPPSPFKSMPVIGYLERELNPHPDKHPTLHVDAGSPDEAWAAISRRRA